MYRLDLSQWTLPAVSEQDKTVPDNAELIAAFRKFISTPAADKKELIAVIRKKRGYPVQFSPIREAHCNTTKGEQCRTTESVWCRIIKDGGHVISKGGRHIDAIQHPNVLTGPLINTLYTPTKDMIEHANTRKYGGGGSTSPPSPPLIISFLRRSTNSRFTCPRNSIMARRR